MFKLIEDLPPDVMGIEATGWPLGLGTRTPGHGR